MGMGVTFFALTEEQLDIIISEENNDFFNEVESSSIRFGIDSEWHAIFFLLSDDAFRKEDCEEESEEESEEECQYEYQDGVALFIDERYELEGIARDFCSCLDDSMVEASADEFNRFTISDLRERFDSSAFKMALENDEIYRGDSLNDEEYFERIANAYKELSNFFNECAKRGDAIIFYHIL